MYLDNKTDREESKSMHPNINCYVISLRVVSRMVQVRQLAAVGSDALREELRELCRRAGVRPAEPVALLVTEANCGDELLAHVRATR